MTQFRMHITRVILKITLFIILNSFLINWPCDNAIGVGRHTE